MIRPISPQGWFRLPLFPSICLSSHLSSHLSCSLTRLAPPLFCFYLSQISHSFLLSFSLSRSPGIAVCVGSLDLALPPSSSSSTQQLSHSSMTKHISTIVMLLITLILSSIKIQHHLSNALVSERTIPLLIA